MDAAVAGRLGPAGEADLGQQLADDGRHPLRFGEVRPRLRVDVDPELVRALDVGAPRGPGMEVEGRQVDRPDHVRELGDGELIGMPS